MSSGEVVSWVPGVSRSNEGQDSFRPQRRRSQPRDLNLAPADWALRTKKMEVQTEVRGHSLALQDTRPESRGLVGLPEQH